MDYEREVTSIQELLAYTKEDYSVWNLKSIASPWFRGQSNSDYKLIPSLFRESSIDDHIVERDINKLFRQRAGAYGSNINKYAYDEWLHLSQHVGIPTRLLDWTEGLLIALYFAIYKIPEHNACIYMLNPLELNAISINEKALGTASKDASGLYYRSSYEDEYSYKDYPIAVSPWYIHPRMVAQKSCFTIHGRKKQSFEEMFSDTLIKNNYLKKYIISREYIPSMYVELKYLV